MRPDSTRAGPLAVALMPSMHWVAKLVQALARRGMDSWRRWAASGMDMASSKLFWQAAAVRAESLPMTRWQTMRTDSGMTGLTLPGMMEEPGWTGGSSISPRPARGPEPIQRMSLAILVR